MSLTSSVYTARLGSPGMTTSAPTAKYAMRVGSARRKMKAIKQALLVLALLTSIILISRTQVTAEVTYDPIVVVNMGCGGVNVKQDGIIVTAITADHCTDMPSGFHLYIYDTNGMFMGIGSKVAVSGDIIVFTYEVYEGREVALADVNYTTPQLGDHLYVPAIDMADGTKLMAVYHFTGLRSFWSDQVFWQVEGVVLKGFSGTPVLNAAGQIVGIMSIGFETDENIRMQPWAGYTDIKVIRHILREHGIQGT